MSFSIDFADDANGYQARIKVIGCGGSGGNAVNTMIHFGLEGVEFMVANTDIQALQANLAPTKLNIGNNVTKGLGAGADPERGRKAALEDQARIKEMLSGADMVFVTAGMGGGTGTGAAPVIAQIAREEGILTVGVVTKPFIFEGRQRARRAEQGLAQLAEQVDTLITIPNQKLLMLGDDDLSFIDAFRKADEVLYQAVRGISDLITQNGIVNVDFADVRTVMSNMGRALMGSGLAKGQSRARVAAEMAIQSPLLDDISVEGATGILINIVGGPDMKMKEIDEAASFIQEQAHQDANIIFGASIDESLGENIKVTVIATGFENAVQMSSHSLGEGAHIQSNMQVFAPPISQTSNTARMIHSTPSNQASFRRETHAPQSSGVQTMSSRRSAVASSYTARPPASSPPPSFSSPSSPSNLRVESAYPPAYSGGAPLAPAPQSSREIGSLGSAQDIDWDVPAFQRRNLR